MDILGRKCELCLRHVGKREQRQGHKTPADEFSHVDLLALELARARANPAMR
jgi:hypothetical protein